MRYALSRSAQLHIINYQMPHKKAYKYIGVTIMKTKLNVIFTIDAIILFLMGLGFTLATTAVLENFG